jgi:uncharacterized integral membrane protein
MAMSSASWIAIFVGAFTPIIIAVFASCSFSNKRKEK